MLRKGNARRSRIEKNNYLYNKKETKKKRLYFKKWVDILLNVIEILLIFFICAECSSTSMFFKSKLICMILLAINTYLINKYSKLFNK